MVILIRSVLFVLLFLVVHSRGTIIPSNRSVTWQGNVGIAGGIPNLTTIYTTVPAGASLATVQSALNSCPADQVVQLSAGNYAFGDFLDWQEVNNGVVLRGAGVGNTTITFTNSSTSACIYMRTFASEAALSVDANLSADAVKGGATLTLASVPSWVTVGKLIGLDQLDDPSFVHNGGTEGGTSYRESVGNGPRGLGQINRVLAKTATTITLEIPLAYGFKVSQTAQIWQPCYDTTSRVARTDCGIENMTLTASFSSSGCHMIKMECCDSCWIKNVEISNMAGGAGVWTAFCYRCELRHNHVHHSHSYLGGQGYGIDLYHVSTGCLIEDNILHNLHLGCGGSYGICGNVFAYNYCFANQSNSNQNPALSTHGTHCFMNLFEGNYCEDKFLGDWTHGSGSNQTLFRNVILGRNSLNPSQQDATPVSTEEYNRYLNVVGNILGVAGFHNAYMQNFSSNGNCGTANSIYKIGGTVNINCDWSSGDTMAVSSPIIHGNYDTVTNSIVWDPTISDHALPSSYYMTSKPSYFGSLAWPPFDPANPSAVAAANIPAGYRYVHGSDPPAASGPLASGVPAAPQNLHIQ